MLAGSAALLCALALLLSTLSSAPGEPASAGAPSPLAIHITVTQAQLPLLPRLYARLFDAGNRYLIDYAPPLTPAAFLALSPAQTAVTTQRVATPSVAHGVSHVINLLDGIAHFLDRVDATGERRFSHYIPTSPASYPAHQAGALRALLQRRRTGTDDASFFHFIHASQQKLFAHEVDLHYLDNTLAFNHSVAPALTCARLPHPDRRRRALPLVRATDHFVLSYRLARFAADSAYAKRLLLLLSETSHVRARFFASLALAGEAEPLYLADVVTGSDNPTNTNTTTTKNKDSDSDNSDNDTGYDDAAARAAQRAAVGPVVRRADLHCVDTDGPDARVLQARPDYAPRAPTVAFLRNTSRPCLFAAPLDEERYQHLRDAIDYELLIAPGTQGKPAAAGYDEIVRARMDAL